MKALTVFVLTVCCAGLAAAAVAPELGYAKLIKGDLRCGDDETQCSHGCCPYANYDCCSDGTHCANNVKSCPGCPNDGTGVGTWCKEFPDEFGELTEDDPCCQGSTPDCNYNNDHEGTCANGAQPFCEGGTLIKCGQECCDSAVTEIAECCPNNTCAPEGECNTQYCAGDWCGPPDPATGSYDPTHCCLPPTECCSDGAGTCYDPEVDTCNPTADCGDDPNTAIVCADDCCPNGYPGCFDSSNGGSADDGSCGGVVCGAAGDEYCYTAEKPYCCEDPDLGCVKHLDDCAGLTTAVPGPECTPGGDQCTAPRSFCCLNGDCAANAGACSPAQECDPTDTGECTGAKDYCCATTGLCVANGQDCSPKECGVEAADPDDECNEVNTALPYCCADGTCVASGGGDC